MNRGFLQSTSDLITCLLQTPPADLLGLALLRQTPPAAGAWFPTAVPLEQVKQATLEFIEYGSRCRETAHKLTGLRPVPLSVSCLEFGL
ncbi:hypothetical protein ANRL4_01853 [Anaerolineae bacterium]|nr:hypothetical protein ANRL4_01853 [Anaerolineae bacterium]